MKLFIDMVDVRLSVHVLEAVLAGAGISAMNFEVLQQLCQHRLTDIGMEMFLNDCGRVLL